MTSAKAIVNNTSIISWKYEDEILNCLGFAAAGWRCEVLTHNSVFLESSCSDEQYLNP